MVPLHPYTIVIDYRTEVNRKPVVRYAADMLAAMAVYSENIGRRDVHRVTVSLIVHQSEKTLEPWLPR